VEDIMNKKEDVLVQVYRMIHAALNFGDVREIVENILRDDNSIEKDDLAHDLYIEFHERGYHERFDENKGNLSKYIKIFVLWRLWARQRIKTTSLNTMTSNETDELRLEGLLRSDHPDPLSNMIASELREVFEELYPEEWMGEIALEERTMADVARDLGLSRETIRLKMKEQNRLNKDSVDDPTHKNCKKCNKYLEINQYNFYKRNRRFSNTCCEWEKERQREYYKKRRG
jgi:hypothetical protein